MNILTSLLLTLTLTSCAQNRPHHERDEPPAEISFQTTITHLDEKKFSLRLTPMANEPREDRGSPPPGGRQAKGKGAPPPGGGGGNGGPLGGGGNFQNNQLAKSQSDVNEKEVTAKLEQELIKELAKTGYCREGHIIHHVFIGSTSHIMTGECLELASQDDRLRYPNDTSDERLK